MFPMCRYGWSWYVVLKLSQDAQDGLKKLRNDLTLSKKRNHSEPTNDTTKFGFIDVLRICIGTVVIVATIKAVVWILEW